MISVIVPIYNVEKYVKPCVDSILNQTYRDLQVILVDDGSTDTSGRICDEYASMDSRVQVIHKTNGGLSDARNAGLDIATGEYICFLDGDDVFHPSMLRVMFDAVESGDYDFSMIYLVAVSEKEAFERLKCPKNNSHPIKKIDQISFVRNLYDYGTNFILNPYVVSTNKLFKHSLISNVRFKITGIEDMEFNNRMCQQMRKAIVVEDELYYWVQRGSSLSHFNQHKFKLLHFNLYEECLEAIPSKCVEHRKECLNAMFKHILSCRYALRGTDSYDESVTLGAKSYKLHEEEYFKSGVNLPTKIMMKVFYHFPWTYVCYRSLCNFIFVNLKVNQFEWFLKRMLQKIRNKKLVVE